MDSTVISYGDSSAGTDKNYLRLVDGDEELTFAVRKTSQNHRSFILATWMRSFTPALRNMVRAEQGSVEPLLKEEAALAESLWSQGVVVGPVEDDFTIYAWLCGHTGGLHYVYVVPELRRRKIASALIDMICGSDYQYGRPWPFKGGPHNGSYNPYLLGKGT